MWLAKGCVGLAMAGGVSMLATWLTLQAYTEQAVEKLPLPAAMKQQVLAGRPDLNQVWNGVLHQAEGLIQQASSAAGSGSRGSTAVQGKSGSGQSGDGGQTKAGTGSAENSYPAVSDDTGKSSRPGDTGLSMAQSGQTHEGTGAGSDDLHGLNEEALPAWAQSSGAGQGQAQSQAGQGSTGSSGGAQSHSASQGGTGSRGGGEIAMSTEQLQRAKESLSAEDKSQIFNIIFNRLSSEELQQISALMEDGLTPEEIAKIQHIVQNRVEPEEMQMLVKLLTKAN
ncbi:hypothetical protein WBG83_20125 [Paenibacillus sp. y28]